MARRYAWYSVYLLSDPFTGDVRYVGCSGNPQSRLSSHLRAAKNEKMTSDKDNWIRSLLSRGASPKLTIAECVRKRFRIHREAFWVNKLSPSGTLLNKQLMPRLDKTIKLSKPGECRINVPIRFGLRKRLRAKAKKEGRIVRSVLLELVEGYVGKAAKK